jgi:hypothetical protein
MSHIYLDPVFSEVESGSVSGPNGPNPPALLEELIPYIRPHQDTWREQVNTGTKVLVLPLQYRPLSLWAEGSLAELLLFFSCMGLLSSNPTMTKHSWPDFFVGSGWISSKMFRQ